MGVIISDPLFVSVTGNGKILKRYEECYDTLEFIYRKRDFMSKGKGLFEYRLCKLTTEGIVIINHFASHRGYINFNKCQSK